MVVALTNFLPLLLVNLMKDPFNTFFPGRARCFWVNFWEGSICRCRVKYPRSKCKYIQRRSSWTINECKRKIIQRRGKSKRRSANCSRKEMCSLCQSDFQVSLFKVFLSIILVNMKHITSGANGFPEICFCPNLLVLPMLPPLVIMKNFTCRPIFFFSFPDKSSHRKKWWSPNFVLHL